MALRILGGGIAGCAAALAALDEGAPVELGERSRYPRHKVCGEFVSPEIAPLLDRLGVWDAFARCEPFPVRRMAVHIGHREKRAALPEAAFGLSRFAFDHLLWQSAIERGASAGATAEAPHIVATGRHLPGQKHRGGLFGFKAHFDGAADDAIELFFFDSGYVGVNCIEGGRTNVCGLAPDYALRECGFRPDALIERCDSLRRRLEPLRRIMDWMFTGPLEFTQRWQRRDVFLAGDSLSFVDPFTGSGMLCAAITGSLAGRCAARRASVEHYLAACRREIRRPFAFSSFLRLLASTRLAETLICWVPPRLLFRLTRPPG